MFSPFSTTAYLACDLKSGVLIKSQGEEGEEGEEPDRLDNYYFLLQIWLIVYLKFFLWDAAFELLHSGAFQSGGW